MGHDETELIKFLHMETAVYPKVLVSPEKFLRELHLGVFTVVLYMRWYGDSLNYIARFYGSEKYKKVLKEADQLCTLKLILSIQYFIEKIEYC